SIVKIAIEYMMKHYSEPMSLAVIAEFVHVTPNYFSRVFRKETGKSFLEWLNRFRIEKAKELLTDLSIKTYEVAERVGFNDYKHFSYNFKKYMGFSPTEYKDKKI
ncbi:MAG: AraC family transcriptional regulator, partial [Eubacteriales bacterium]|nr:AraC family transcriptional regulator [Eubacteriales bacterium]